MSLFNKCPLYNINRLELYSEIRKISSDFDYLTNIQKMIYIMRNENTAVIIKLTKFVYECMKIRKEHNESELKIISIMNYWLVREVSTH